MSVFGKLFGGKKGGDKPQTTGEAIPNLRETVEMLKKKHDFLKKKIESEMVVARKNAKTNKRMAMKALKKKKRYDKQLQQIDGTLKTIEQQRKEISEAISNPVAFGQDFDEDELEAELNELEMEGDMEEQEKLEAELLDVGVADQLPETPREEPAAAVAKPAQGNLLRGIDICSGAARYVVQVC